MPTIELGLGRMTRMGKKASELTIVCDFPSVLSRVNKITVR